MVRPYTRLYRRGCWAKRFVHLYHAYTLRRHKQQPLEGRQHNRRRPPCDLSPISSIHPREATEAASQCWAFSCRSACPRTHGGLLARVFIVLSQRSAGAACSSTSVLESHRRATSYLAFGLRNERLKPRSPAIDVSLFRPLCFECCINLRHER